VTRPPPDPGQRLLGLLGLGLRSGRVAVGVEATRAMLQRGDARVVIIASNASERAVEKVVALAQGKAVPVLTGPEAVTIGERLGRPPVMTVAVRDRDLAAGMLAAMANPDGR
jgi:ribosomal protein L7Ae-like RNA K-turn-binding protein